MGIRGMRERLRPFEGPVNIESDNSGTKILITVPVPTDGPPVRQGGLGLQQELE